MVAAGQFATTFVGSYLIPLLVALSALAIATMVTTLFKLSSHLRTQDSTLAEIKKEVLPNGGASLRDSVNRIELQQAQQAGVLDEHLRRAAKRRKKMDKFYAEYYQRQHDPLT